MLAPWAHVFLVDLKSDLLCHFATTSAVIMAHFFRGPFSLLPVIILVISLLPFCRSKKVFALERRTETVTMADVNFSCPAGGKWYI